MPLPVISDTFRAAVRGKTTTGVQWVNVLHFRKTGVLTMGAAIAVLDPFLFGMYNANIGAGTAWKTIAPTAASMQDIVYTPLDGASASTVIQHAINGGNATAATDAAAAITATLRTALRGRSHRGRCYWGPLTSAFLTDAAHCSAAAATGVATQWAGLLTNLAGSGVSLVVASYKTATATDVASVTVDTRLDTQRRRLGKL